METKKSEKLKKKIKKLSKYMDKTWQLSIELEIEGKGEYYHNLICNKMRSVTQTLNKLQYQLFGEY